ncbi:MAG: S-methyl-5-thioribose-1-phosphate isomerase [Candidatus Cloacimonadota bacterium]|nr:MAG: S-methyl-5-thioribose-1-phosphate isomerase [Candidatus Cloacimonadota bacterium]
MQPIKFENDVLLLIDQLKLPMQEVWVKIKTLEEGAKAIKDMIVRGAPAIGVTAAYTYALAFKNKPFSSDYANLVKETLNSTRPTAVNLFWAVSEMEKVAKFCKKNLYTTLLNHAKKIHADDITMNKKIGANALDLFPKKLKVLTHCNAGSLATGGYGTALGVIYSAFSKNLIEKVWVDETRPFLQGARLTAYELEKAGVPNTLICDNMSASLMAKGEIDLVVVGSDRIAKNGDVANKIGTYAVAVLAQYHKIPFYVAAPSSTIDFNIACGNDIPIEERAKSELGIFNGKQIVYDLDNIYNPGFDVTPNHLVSGIITEEKVHYYPYINSLKVCDS